jgi:hypothetical protein
LRNTPRWPPLNVTFRKIPGSINFTLDFGSNWSVLTSQTRSVSPHRQAIYLNDVGSRGHRDQLMRNCTHTPLLKFLA